MKRIQSLAAATFVVIGTSIAIASSAEAGGFLSDLIGQTVKEVIQGAEERVYEHKRQQQIKARNTGRNLVDCALTGKRCPELQEEKPESEDANK